MTTPGRNDPCPCGSGKKYKRCCLRAERAAASESAQGSAVRIALEWLHERHLRAVKEALRFYLDAAGEGFELSIDHPELEEMFQINFSEWLLAEAELRVDRWKSAFDRRRCQLR